mmetsp:Transcript_54969/g.63216  ORF Transcript_54969/g.63216 Transcript_54969/m.63216 type:complete len:203 (-) Transcript_54969:431-1039(-)
MKRTARNGSMSARKDGWKISDLATASSGYSGLYTRMLRIGSAGSVALIVSKNPLFSTVVGVYCTRMYPTARVDEMIAASNSQSSMPRPSHITVYTPAGMYVVSRVTNVDAMRSNGSAAGYPSAVKLNGSSTDHTVDGAYTLAGRRNQFRLRHIRFRNSIELDQSAIPAALIPISDSAFVDWVPASSLHVAPPNPAQHRHVPL